MTPTRRATWRALCAADSFREPGSVWTAISDLLDLAEAQERRIEDLERDRAWAVRMLEKEILCRRATLRSVAGALAGPPIRGVERNGKANEGH